jgi:hypothetical protein
VCLFRAPDDPGYGHDDYGGGRELTLDYLRILDLKDYQVFWPTAPSSDETGKRRGCVVLANKGRVSQALAATSLIRASNR